jgi:hypothetical protein
MSETDIPLLGHNDELTPVRIHASSATHRSRRARISIQALAVSLFIPLLIFSILYLRWNYEFKAAGTTSTAPSSPILAGGPTRDLKSLLHPEAHISRDPGIRRFSWNITKATIAPNGVEKDVFLINSTITTLSAYNKEVHSDDGRSISRSHDRGSVWRYPRD